MNNFVITCEHSIYLHFFIFLIKDNEIKEKIPHLKAVGVKNSWVFGRLQPGTRADIQRSKFRLTLVFLSKNKV